jgi:acyl carrier protein
METSLEEDLGADSVDVVELVMAMEEEFDVGEVQEDELTGMKTVGDAVRYLSKKFNG